MKQTAVLRTTNQYSIQHIISTAYNKKNLKFQLQNIILTQHSVNSPLKLAPKQSNKTTDRDNNNNNNNNIIIIISRDNNRK